MHYFISYTLFHVLNTPFRYKQSSIAHSGLFWIYIVTSSQLCEHEAVVLLRHIRRLFLHAQIGAKAIYTSE